MKKHSSISLTPPAKKEQVIPPDLSAQSQVDSADYIGPCPECGNPVIEYDNHFACSHGGDGGCPFTYSVNEIKDVVEANIANLLCDPIIGDKVVIRRLMRYALSSPGKHEVTWYYMDDTLYEYYELQFVKGNCGQWELRITRDDEELAALAKEGFARIFEA